MHLLRYLLCFFVVVFTGIFCLGEDGDKKQEVKPPQPALSIYFERSSVEIGDSVVIVVQVTNPSDIPVSDCQLTMNGPAFLQLSSTEATTGHPIAIGNLPAFSALNDNKLHLVVLPKALVGDFNLVFTLSYHWNAGKNAYQSQVTAEKSLTVGLFGTDKVIGIPLAFAQFIVPGLFFLSLLGLLKVPFFQTAGTHEKLIMSVLISAVCLFIMSFIGRNTGWKWSQQFDRGGTISIEKLFVLALSGIVLGLLVSACWHLYQRWRRQQEAKIAFRGDEPYYELVRKALQLNSAYEGQPWQFTCIDGTVYIGSHYFETAFSYILLGAFKINREEWSKDEQKLLDKYSENGMLIQSGKQLLAVVKLLATKKATQQLFVRNPVKKKVQENLTDVDAYVTITKEEFRARQHVREQKMQLVELI